MPKYEKKISLGRDKDGKLIRKSIYANSKLELEKKVFQAKQAYLQTCSEKPNNSITFVSFAWRWYEQEKVPKSFYTRMNYRNIIKNYFAPNLDGLYFQELTLADFQNIINDSWQYPAICDRIKKTLGQIYAAAEDSDILTVKPPNFRRLVLPKKVKKQSRRPLTANEKDALFSADLNDKEKAFVYILYYTGMRREEALALEPSCFDFRRKEVTVRQTVTFNGQTILEKSAKNNYSLRSILLPEPCVQFLKEYCASCKRFLFPSVRDSERLMSHTAFEYFWNRIRRKLSTIAPEAEELTPHYFRHNYATMLYYSNISPKKAAALLGHANTKMIMEIYAHLDEEKENASEKLNAIFGG